MPDSIYILIDYKDDIYSDHYAFSTREKAEEYKKLFNLTKSYVETLIIDPELPEHPEGKYPFYVYVRQNKSTNKVESTSIVNFSEGYRSAIDYYITFDNGHTRQYSNSRYKMCLFYIFAENEHNAREIAYTWTNRLIDEGKWDNLFKEKV